MEFIVAARSATYTDGKWEIPNLVNIVYIRGDGIGIDVTPVMLDVVNKAVELCYQGKKSINWIKAYAGDEALSNGCNSALPDETLDLIRQHKIAIKGPLTTPVGGGIRSLNVAIRQALDLYVCMRPIRYFPGCPSPLKKPENTDMVIFRENSEGIYIGIEWAAGSQDATDLINWIEKKIPGKIPHKNDCGIGIKVNSRDGSQRLIDEAIKYAIQNKKDSVTIVHKGNIMKFTEGAFRDWGYELCMQKYSANVIGEGPWCIIKDPKTGHEVTVKDCIADAFLQNILIKPKEYDVIATMNLNGDYISDALAAQVGGIGIAPGANVGDGVAVFEATHGTAPGYAGQDKVNPGSLILSAEMMLRHMGWCEAADLIVAGLAKCIINKNVTYDFARMMDDAILLSCSEFGRGICSEMTNIASASEGVKH